MTQQEEIRFRVDEANRQPVTAEWLWNHPDVTGYIFNYASHEMGLDPWRVITGVDRWCKGDNYGRIILQTGTIGEKTVNQDYIVYVSKKVIV